MTTVGFIGSGNIGGTVARLAIEAGYDVVLSNSRGPQILADLLEDLGPRGRAPAPAKAAAVGDPVVVSIPPRAYILGALIIYYLLKDGTRLRQSLVAQVDSALRDEIDGSSAIRAEFFATTGGAARSCPASWRWSSGWPVCYSASRSCSQLWWSNFIGGYIPYIGAFLGGGLAVIVALGDGGLGDAAVMLVVVLAANLVLEDFVEPKVMGGTLDIHPLIVLVVTALGGIVGGIVGLILAVPFYVIARNAFARLRSRGFFAQVAVRAEPTVRDMLQ